MSHFTVTVCLEPTPPAGLRAALDAAMAPFDHNSPDGNPDGAWDRWHIESDDEGFFVARPEHDGDARLIHQERSEPGERPRCAGGPRGLLDFDATRALAADRARAWQQDQEADLDTAATWSLVTFALLTLDGRWADAEWSGEFATPLADESESDAYAREASAYLESLDDNCLVVRLNCHG